MAACLLKFQAAVTRGFAEILIGVLHGWVEHSRRSGPFRPVRQKLQILNRQSGARLAVCPYG